MRSVKCCVLFIVLSTFGSAIASAGGIDNVNEFGAAKLRTMTRGASTEVDAAVYNPAGLLKLDDGFYASLGNLSVFDAYDTQLGSGEEFRGSADVFAIPSAFLVFKKEPFALFFNFTVPGGGGAVAYDKGSPTSSAIANQIAAGVAAGVGETIGAPITDGHAVDLQHSLDAASMYLGLTLGGAYEINKMISVALGGRYILASNQVDARMSMGVDGSGFPFRDMSIQARNQYESTAAGIGGILGVNIAPDENLNIGLRVETPTKLEFETKQLKNTATVESAIMESVSPGAAAAIAAGIIEQGDSDGVKADRDLPAMAAIGVSYRLLPRLIAEVDFMYYLNTLADWDGAEKDFANSWEVAASVEYALLDSLRASAGADFSSLGGDKENYGDPESAEFDSVTVGAGIAYEPIAGFVVDVGYARPIYSTIEADDGSTLEKSRHVFGLGIEYKLF